MSFVVFVSGQIPKGTWREHLPYNSGKMVALAGERVFCATELALFYYDTSEGSIQKLSKINGLSDLGIGCIAFSNEHQKLIVGYENGNIDVLKNDEKFNFPDIKEKNMVGDKTIYHILIDGDFAYLSCGFGIVVFNLLKNEITDSYVFGTGGTNIKINGTALFNDSIFACTDQGLYKAALTDPFLSNYTRWIKDTGTLNPNLACYCPVVFNNQLFMFNTFSEPDSSLVNLYNGNSWDTVFTNYSQIRSLSVSENQLVVIKIYHVMSFDQNLNLIENYSAHNAQHAVHDTKGNFWLADSKEGLLLHTPDTYKTTILPNGPLDKNAFEMAYQNNRLFVLPGGYQRTGIPAYSQANLSTFQNETWSSLPDSILSKILGVNDAVCVAANSHYTYIGSWGKGIVEIKDGSLTNVFNSENTPALGTNFISSLAFDNDGNLWAINRNSPTPFAVKTPAGEWYSYSYDESLSKKQTYKAIYTSNGDFWHISLKGNGLFVWNSNDTPETGADDTYKAITVRSETTTYSQYLYDIEQDLEGTIWLGTADGVVVYDYPYKALTETIYGRRPQLVVDGYLNNLLEGELVTAIAVDGANRKWLGTEGGGLFLVSADGTEQLMVLNKSNSKLFSNNIISLEINPKSGELFIGTDKGLQSYMSTASAPYSDFSSIYAFPNPVKEGYSGYITIRGLMYETGVKITDLSGHLVYETTSNGGDAIWNGKNLKGEDVASGIYLVLCITELGTEVEATKILIVR